MSVRSRYDIILPRFDDVYHAVARVDAKSTLRFRRAVARIARYFQREGGFDFIGYGVDGHETDPTCVAFLWVDDFVAVGACCFRWREWADAPPGPTMTWAWLHPYVRRQGWMTEEWPRFRAEFGAFYVEHPLSPAMASFLAKVGHVEMAGADAPSAAAGNDVTERGWAE